MEDGKITVVVVNEQTNERTEVVVEKGEKLAAVLKKVAHDNCNIRYQGADGVPQLVSREMLTFLEVKDGSRVLLTPTVKAG